MHRFFVPSDVRTGNAIARAGPVAHQIARVLRLRAGEEIVLIPRNGANAVEWQVRLETAEARAVHGRVVAERPGLPEPTCAVTLCAALLKGERFDWLLQKTTELGVAAIQPLVTAHTIRKIGPEETQTIERWQRIVTEAAEQSGRSRVPHVAAPTRLDRLAARINGPLLVAHEGEQARTLSEVIAPDAAHVAIVIGPEGGLAEGEVDTLAARDHAVVVSLGPRILRAETAAITAVTLAMAATENLQPPRPRAWRAIGEISGQ